MNHSKTIDKEYWEELYNSNDIGWDIGYPAPALSNYIDQLNAKDLKILIPGCGNSYEAEYLLDKGFTDITLVDIAEVLTRALEKKFETNLGKELTIVTGDFYNLDGQFDLILEQTFLSTTPIPKQKNYRDKMFQLLKPGGKLVGVLFNHKFDEEGPPFGSTKEEYEELFKEKFVIKVLETCYNSIDRRIGSEVFINLQKE